MIDKDDDLLRYKCLECDNIFYEDILEEDETCNECFSKNVVQYPEDEDYFSPSDEEIENEIARICQDEDDTEEALARWEDAQNGELQ
ncbi:MAG: hypothetical protein WCY75_04330 [Sulfurimonadaceae bacterium]